jgi:hypothetical protein
MKILSRSGRAAVIAAILLLAGCATAVRPTAGEQVRAMRGRDLNVVLHSGREVLLRSAYVEGDSVFGGWTSGPAGDVRVAVALADVARVKAGARLHSERPSARAVRVRVIGAVMSVVLVAAALVSLLNAS